MNTAFSKCFWYLQKQYPNTMTADIVYRITPAFPAIAPCRYSSLPIFLQQSISLSPTEKYIPQYQKKNDLQNNRIDFKKLANDFICNLTQLSFLRNVFQITLYKVLIFILGYQQTVPVSHFHLCPVISFHIFYVNQIPFVYTEKSGLSSLSSELILS